MNIYLAVFGALVCAFMGGFLAQWLISQPKRDKRGRFCK